MKVASDEQLVAILPSCRPNTAAMLGAEVSRRPHLLWGFLNEMDALEPCWYITLEGFVMSSSPVPPVLPSLAPFHQETSHAATWWSPVTIT